MLGHTGALTAGFGAGFTAGFGAGFTAGFGAGFTAGFGAGFTVREKRQVLVLGSRCGRNGRFWCWVHGVGETAGFRHPGVDHGTCTCCCVFNL
uniref:Uncharacterized protein n=1 Tax=Knipowitschia caucasica TaxID=637954 RepID=A0AAV2KN17_KNICA